MRASGRDRLRWTRASVLGFVLTLLLFPSCSSEESTVRPSLDPRASRILALRVPDLLEGRECLIYLPAGFPAARQRYPVLYVQDGESAFDRASGGESFGFDATADAMIARGEIAPLIIVAIPSGGHRFRDYVPDVVSDGSTLVIDRSRGGGAYLEAIATKLKPRIDRSFATDPRAAATGVTGFSLGGLISVCALYDRPEAFGIAGGCSGSYLWSRSFLPYVSSRDRPLEASLWIDTGLIDDNQWDARWLNEIVLAQGFTPGLDYEYLEVQDGTHSIPSARRRLPAFLRFFSRRAAASRSDHVGDQTLAGP